LSIWGWDTNPPPRNMKPYKGRGKSASAPKNRSGGGGGKPPKKGGCLSVMIIGGASIAAIGEVIYRSVT